jgi:multisubunit Na+/H+ antiporter MnhB subunit
MVQLISIILAFLIIYTLFKTRETSNSSRKLRMLVYTFWGIIFLLGLVSVVLGTYGLLNSYNVSENWRINMSFILVVLSGFLLVVLSYVGISRLKRNVR